MVNTTKEVGMGITDKLFSYIRDAFQISVSSEINQLGFLQTGQYVNQSSINEIIPDTLDEKRIITELIEKYKFNSDYFQFLNKCKQDILKMYESCENVSCDIIQDVFNKFKPVFEHLQSTQFTVSFEVKKFLLLYMIPVNTEYLNNNIAPGKLMGLKKLNTYTYLMSGLSNKCKYKVNKSVLLSKYAINFFDKYNAFTGQSYVYLPSIFSLVMENSIDYNAFDDELHHLTLNWNHLLESHQLCKLVLFDDLESEEFQSLITRVKNMVIIGRYSFKYYNPIFLYINYFSVQNYISCTDAAILNVFKNGLTSSSLKIKYDPAFLKSYDLVEEDSIMYKKLKDIAENIDSKLRHQKNKELSLNLIRLLPEHTDLFVNFFVSKKNVYFSYPVLSYLSNGQIFPRLLYMHKTDLEKFNKAIEKRYLDDVRYSRKNFSDDLTVISKLKTDINCYLNEKNSRIVASVSHLIKIESTLDDVLQLMDSKEKLSA